MYENMCGTLWKLVGLGIGSMVVVVVVVVGCVCMNCGVTVVYAQEVEGKDALLGPLG